MKNKWMQKIPVKKGLLHRHLNIPENEKIPDYALEKLSKITDGTEFTYKGYKIKMTSQLKKEVTLALTFRKSHA